MLCFLFLFASEPSSGDLTAIINCDLGLRLPLVHLNNNPPNYHQSLSCVPGNTVLQRPQRAANWEDLRTRHDPCQLRQDLYKQGWKFSAQNNNGAALYCFQEAAALGNFAAMDVLCRMYRDGVPNLFPGDPEKARQLSQKVNTLRVQYQQRHHNNRRQGHALKPCQNQPTTPPQTFLWPQDSRGFVPVFCGTQPHPTPVPVIVLEPQPYVVLVPPSCIIFP